MPRFFFEVVQDGDIREDRVGVDLPSLKELKPFAVRRAAEVLLAAAELDPIDWWLMEVRDENRAVVGRVSFVASSFEAASSIRSGDDLRCSNPTVADRKEY